MVQGFKQKQGKPVKAAHMSRKNAVKQRKNKDYFSKTSHKLSTVSHPPPYSLPGNQPQH